MITSLAHSLLSATLLFAALSSSAHYNLNSYNVSAGATNTSSSTTYKLNGNAGGISSGASPSSTDKGLPGVIQAQQANVPAAPTLSNGSNTYYNKLGFILNIGSDPTDYTYAIAVSTDNFATVTKYVQADGTLGTAQVYQTYTTWGGASGSTIVGLLPNTSYQVKAGSMQGLFTASLFGPYATISTVNPSLTFSLSPSTLTLTSLLAGTIITSSSITTTFATNAASGGSIYIAGQNGGLLSSSTGFTITSISSDLATQSFGFGAQGSSATQSSGGPLAFVSPFNGATTNIGAPQTTYKPLLSTSAPVVGGSATSVLKAKSSSITPAGQDYQEVLTFVASASY
jgi:hypothetical protein